MTSEPNRRDVIKGGVSLIGLSLLASIEHVLPVLAQGETLVPFTDLPNQNFQTVTGVDRRIQDVRKVTAFTPKDEFFTTQHYGHPEIDPAAFRLKVTGLVDRPQSLSLDELKKLGSVELIAGFECSGNRRPLQGLCGNGRWTGLPLKTVLDRAGVKAQAQEFVFYGADHGEEEVEFRTQKLKIDQRVGRSLRREKAMSPEIFVAYAMNGEPLTKHQGAPLRLIVPGWYGVANVKWLSEIHLQEDEYMGKYQTRWYRTMWAQDVDGKTVWNETAVTHMRPKSFVARVSRDGSAYKVVGVILNDGSAIKSVEVKVDNGPWQPATVDPATRSKYGWKLFNYAWNNPAPGEHTIVSRLIEANGAVQPTEEELGIKKTFLEDNSQFPRKLTI
jgi:DMSO/TMAO reductase YedYZ molybdopterin-dependent catalytic subunit